VFDDVRKAKRYEKETYAYDEKFPIAFLINIPQVDMM